MPQIVVALLIWPWATGREAILPHDDNTEYADLLLRHVQASFHNPERINNSETNRKLLNSMLFAHGVDQVIYFKANQKPIIYNKVEVA